jgi:amino acid transporter
MILSVAIGGGAIYLIALFGHLAISYRLAMAISIFISYVNMRGTDWNEVKPEDDIKTLLSKWGMELCGTIGILLALGLCSLAFMWLK